MASNLYMQIYGPPALRASGNGSGYVVSDGVELGRDQKALREGTGKARGKSSIEKPEVLLWEAFPVSALPTLVAEHVRAQAAAIGCDPAFLAMPVLAVLAAAIGNTFRVQIKRSWEESAVLWVAVAAPSGSAKSPAHDAALLPVYLVEREAEERYQTELAAYEVAAHAYDSLAKSQKQISEEPRAPQRQRHRMSDVTVESVLWVHSENPRGLLLARDELAGLLGSFDRYTRGASDEQAWIEMHSGRPLVVDRKTSSPPVLHIDRAAVSVTGTIQPRILRERLTLARFDSGFAVRFLIAMPPVTARRWSEADVTEEVREGYVGLVRRLYALPYDGRGRALSLSSGAKVLFREFVDTNGALTYRLPEGPLHSFLAKTEATAARLALTLHLAMWCSDGEHAGMDPGPVSEEAMCQALRLTRWLRHETARLYQWLGFGAGRLSEEEQIVQDLPAPFSWQDVAKAASVKTKSGAFKVINRLLEAGVVRRVEHGKYEKAWTEETVDYGDFGDYDPGEG